ncbi:MAG: hypothetical protein H6658_09505 [Ardenticatenaceae bacterium]|nr:hypothetical protein [Ardenticatenaceae bacterium]
MPIITFNEGNKPSVTELRQMVQAAAENYDPIEELLQLERQLAELEQTHNLASAEFHRLYQAGQMGDDVQFVAWAGRYRLYLRLKESISNSLKLVLAESLPPSFAA